MDQEKQVNEFGRGWPIVAAAALGVGLGLSPLPFYTIDVMVGPLGEEFGWTRGEVYGSIAICTFSGLIMAPVIGMITEKIGARLVALSSMLLFGLAVMALSLNTGNKILYFALWFLLAVAGAGTFPITLSRPINNWFDKQRGMALGIALIATGVFGALAKYYAQYMVDWVGWRGAYVALGLLPIIISLPVAFLTLRDVHDEPASEAAILKFKIPLLGISLAGSLLLAYFAFQFVAPQFLEKGMTLQYGMAFAFMFLVILPPLAMMFLDIRKETPEEHVGKGPVESPGLTLVEALKTWRFWLLAICFVPISYAIGAIIPSIVPILASKGYSIADAVSLASLTGLAVLGGRLIGGYLIDRFWAPAVAFVFLASPSIALHLLTGDVSSNTATIAILMIGFGAGVEYDFMAYLVSKYFGMRRYSAIYGALYGFFAAGAGFGPTLMNNLADSQGWDLTLNQGAIALFVATIPLLFIGRYRKFDPIEKS